MFFTILVAIAVLAITIILLAAVLSALVGTEAAMIFSIIIVIGYVAYQISKK